MNVVDSFSWPLVCIDYPFVFFDTFNQNPFLWIFYFILFRIFISHLFLLWHSRWRIKKLKTQRIKPSISLLIMSLANIYTLFKTHLYSYSPPFSLHFQSSETLSHWLVGNQPTVFWDYCILQNTMYIASAIQIFHDDHDNRNISSMVSFINSLPCNWDIAIRA